MTSEWTNTEIKPYMMSWTHLSQCRLDLEYILIKIFSNLAIGPNLSFSFNHQGTLLCKKRLLSNFHHKSGLNKLKGKTRARVLTRYFTCGAFGAHMTTYKLPPKFKLEWPRIAWSFLAECKKPMTNGVFFYSADVYCPV